MEGQDLSGRSDLLIDFCKKYQGNYIEIGCFDGQNLCLVAEGIPNSIAFGIDPFLGDVFTLPSLGYEESKSGKRESISKQNLYNNIKNYKNVIFFEKTTEQFMNSISDLEIIYMNISVCYVDGCHHENFVIYDALASLKFIGNKKGVIVFDDMHNPEVLSAVSKFISFMQENKIKFQDQSEGILLINT